MFKIPNIIILFELSFVKLQWLHPKRSIHVRTSNIKDVKEPFILLKCIVQQKFILQEHRCPTIQLVNDTKSAEDNCVIRNAQAVIDLECIQPTFKPVECIVDQAKGMLFVSSNCWFIVDSTQYRQYLDLACLMVGNVYPPSIHSTAISHPRSILPSNPQYRRCPHNINYMHCMNIIHFTIGKNQCM